MKIAKDVPIFSEAQIKTFNSGNVDSLDETLAVLDETNKTTIGQMKSFEENKRKHTEKRQRTQREIINPY